MSTQPHYVDSARGMRGRVHVRIFDPADQTYVVATHRDGNPFSTAAKARAYAMRWKRHGNPRGYIIEFADAGPSGFLSTPAATNRGN